MKETIKRLTKNKYSYLFLMLTGILVFACSTVRLDMLSDDGCYLQMMEDNPGFFRYISYTYQYLNGRLVANTLMFVMLKLNSLVLWIVITTAAVLSIAYNVSRMFGKRASIKGMTLVLGLIFCLNFRVLSSSMLWFTGAIFYVWPISLAIYLLARLSQRFYADEPLRFDWRFVCDLVIGVLVMLWAEQPALVLIGFYLLYFLYQLVLKKKKLDYLNLIATVLWIVFFCVMFFAPSQRIKMNNVYGYAALEGGVGYLLQNGIYWLYRSVFVEQRVLMLLIGAVALIGADRKQHPILTHTFEVIFSVAFLLTFIYGISFDGFINASSYIFGISYLPDSGYSVQTLLPYAYWTLYSALLITIFLVSTKNKILTSLTMLASLATLIIMWFSTTMYASGNRTCALFCMGVIALTVKMIEEREKDCTALIVGVGAVNMTLFATFLMNSFVIYY